MNHLHQSTLWINIRLDRYPVHLNKPALIQGRLVYLLPGVLPRKAFVPHTVHAIVGVVLPWTMFLSHIDEDKLLV